MVCNRQVVQQTFPFWGKPKENFTVIIFPGNAPHCAVFCQPVYKFYGTVMADEHPRGQLADRGLHAVWQAFDCQEKLVLLWLDSANTRLVFTEA
jgi:hypothetical protein